MTDLDFDINKFDFEDLHKKVLKFNYQAYIKKLGKPKKYTIEAPGKKKTKYTIGFDVAIEKDSILHAVIESILSKTEYKKHASLISKTYHSVFDTETLDKTRNILLNR